MAFEQKDMTGSLFQNKEKKSDNFPDYSGSVKINGKDAWISGWRKTDKNGNTYLSLSLKYKDGTSARPTQEQKAQEFKDEAKRVFDLDGDSVPF